MLEQLLLPDWSDLIRLLPWVIGALVVGWLVFTAVQWSRAGARNRSRVPRPLKAGAPPPGIHLPGPSRWPFVAPIGGALILFSFALPTRDASGATVSPINMPLFIAGLIVGIIAIGGWLLEAMREWRATAAADQLGAGSVHQAHALAPGATSALVPAGISSRRAVRRAARGRAHARTQPVAVPGTDRDGADPLRADLRCSVDRRRPGARRHRRGRLADRCRTRVPIDRGSRSRGARHARPGRRLAQAADPDLRRRCRDQPARHAGAGRHQLAEQPHAGRGHRRARRRSGGSGDQRQLRRSRSKRARSSCPRNDRST